MDKLRRFMAGRNGPDQLVIALLIIYWPFSLTGRFTGIRLFESLALACLIFAVFRCVSKNLPQRRRENQQFLQLVQPLSTRSQKYVRRIKEYKTNRYFTCPGCGQSLRVPAGKGRISIRCPKCDTVFEKKT